MRPRLAVVPLGAQTTTRADAAGKGENCRRRSTNLRSINALASHCRLAAGSVRRARDPSTIRPGAFLPPGRPTPRFLVRHRRRKWKSFVFNFLPPRSPSAASRWCFGRGRYGNSLQHLLGIVFGRATGRSFAHCRRVELSVLCPRRICAAANAPHIFRQNICTRQPGPADGTRCHGRNFDRSIAHSSNIGAFVQMGSWLGCWGNNFYIFTVPAGRRHVASG